MEDAGSASAANGDDGFGESRGDETDAGLDQGCVVAEMEAAVTETQASNQRFRRSSRRLMRLRFRRICWR